MGALRVFESAARHLSFTRAADELFVTQGAVSQQIKHLEEQLGMRLFVREPRRLRLTREGRVLATAAAEAMERIRAALDSLRAGSHDGPLTVTTIASFAMQWLIPRLGGFRERYPDIDVRIHADDRLVDLHTEDIDMAVRYGALPQHDASHCVTRLMDDEVFPVCSPALLQRQPELAEPGGLRRAVLIHDETDRGGNLCSYTWAAWLRHAGIDGVDHDRGPSYYQGHMVVQAAVAGQGVALTRESLVVDELRAGRLQRLYQIAYPAPDSYYLVYLRRRAEEPSIQAMARWLLAECGAGDDRD